MSHDDDNRDDADDEKDPWADLEAGELPDLAGDFSVSFDDEPEAAAGDEPASDEVAEPLSPSAAGDSDIDAWLNDPGDEPRPSLSVFQEDEAASPADEGDHAILDRSEVEIGTGQSGLPSPSSLEMTSDFFTAADGETSAVAEDEFGFFADTGDGLSAGEPGTGLNGFAVEAMDDGSAEVASADADVAFTEVAESPAPAEGIGAMAAASGGDPDRPGRKSAVGPLLGILGGGLLAIPITLGILLLGFGRDPFGVARLLPESLAFLAPAPPPVAPAEPGARMAASTPAPLAAVDLEGSGLEADSEPEEAAESAGVTADSADAAAVSLAVDAMMDGSDEGEPAADPATDGALEPGGDPLMDDAADRAVDPVLDQALEPVVDPVMETPAIEPDPAALLATLEPVAAVAVEPSAEPEAMPKLEPLDLTAVEETAAAAVAVTAEVATVEDLSAPAHRRDLAAWYRTLASYADSLAAVDHAALETGRGLEEAAASMMAVQQEIASHPAIHPAIARLARDWIDFDRRPNDGVVVPARFRNTRPVGPWWRSEVLVGDSEGRPDRLFVVMTRSEPAAAPDDLVLVTGLTVDADVIWASDLWNAPPDASEPGP